MMCACVPGQVHRIRTGSHVPGKAYCRLHASLMNWVSQMADHKEKRKGQSGPPAGTPDQRQTLGGKSWNGLGGSKGSGP